MNTKNFLTTFLMGITMISLSSCNIEKIHLTYGILDDTESTSIRLTNWTYDDINARMNEYGDMKNESFLLAVYDSDGGCGCWNHMEPALEKYQKLYETAIYKIDTCEFDNKDNFNLTVTSATSRMYIINKGKIIKEFIHTVSLFDDINKLFSEISRYVSYKNTDNGFKLDTNMYYVTQNHLNNAIKTKKTFVIDYMWSFCPDCQYCTPNVLMPFASSNKLSIPIWNIDLGPLVFNDQGQFDKNNPTYVKAMNDYHLSSNSDDKFGYSTGKVPTIQYWNNGQIKDAAVYFNDVISKENDKYTISDSFYTQERMKNLSYLDEVETPVLKGMELNSLDVTNDSWNKSAAAKYHTPLYNAFLNKYTKK